MMGLGFLSRFKSSAAERSRAVRVAQLLPPAQLLQREGKSSAAMAAYRSVLEVDAEHWEAQNAIAALTLQSGDLEGAILLYSALIARKPDYSEAYYKRGNALNGLGRWNPAVADYNRAIELEPRHANAFCNRGAALGQLSRWNEALDSYDRALELNAGDFLAYFNRGSALRALRLLEEAASSYEHAIALKSDYAEAYINRGHVLQELRRYADALASYDAAIELNPSFAEAFSGRGQSQLSLKSFEAAIASFDRALALNSSQRYLLGLRRHAQMQICQWAGLALDSTSISERLERHLAVCTPHHALALFDVPFLHRAAAEIWVREECPTSAGLGEITAHPRADRIRLGYFSADFRNHPVALLAAEIFERHDRSRFEVIAFAFGPEGDDVTRTRLQGAFDRFIDVRSHSDSQVAALARELCIDIAVDLGGFTEFSRTKIFAARAAPLQVSFLGYPGTMGADYMDYLIADRVVIPPETAGHYCEKILYLPGSFMPHDSTRAIADTIYSKEQFGLPTDAFVFCCFNNSFKIMPATFDSWMRILARAKNSVLWLSRNNAAAAANLRQETERRGIDSGRLIFAERMPLAAEHLARHQVADLFLDTLPYNAHATALDALWAGLPVLTLAGSAFAGRVGASLLTAIELPEMITRTTAQYEDTAVRLAQNPTEMAMVRQKLSRNRRDGALFDSDRHVRSLEAGYADIHDRYHAGLPAASVGPSS